jgi:hypothetical protein
LTTLKEMLPIWRESYQKASEELVKSIFQMAFALFLFAMIDAAQLSSIELFGLSFRTTGVPLLVLFIVATFLYYRCMALMYFSAVVEKALRTAYFKFFGDYDHVGLCDLLMYPSIMQI